MFSLALLKQTMRENAVLWLVLTVVQCLLIFIMGLTAPIAAAGVAYYNMLPGIFAGIYAIATGNRLICGQVDRGTLAYVLSTPIRRRAVVATQATFFAGSLIVMYGLGAVAHGVAALLSDFGAGAGEIQVIAKLNFGLFVLALAFAGVCFAASCVFNLSKYTIAVGGGLVGAFLILPIMAMFGEHFHFLTNLTIVSLYDVAGIMAGTPGWVWRLLILAGIGLAGFIAGGVAFVRRDLPL